MDINLIGQFGLGLFIILLLMIALVYLLRFLQEKKGMFSPQSKSLKVLQNVHLGGKNRLSVLQWGEVQYLVGISPNGMSLLDQDTIEKEKVSKSKSSSEQTKMTTKSKSNKT